MSYYFSANSNKNKLQFQLMDVGNKLFYLSSSIPHILNVLMETEKVLSMVQQLPSKATTKVLHPIIQALIAENLVRHPDVNVNISVVCCICEIIRIMEPNAPFSRKRMKEFFEVLVTSFENSAAVGYRGRMTNVLRIFRNTSLPLMMLDLQLEGLVGRLFKQFLTSADSNTSASLFEMEKIMTMIIDESKELALNLEALIIATLDKIDSPVCWQLGEKVLNCACKRYNIFNPDMEAKETIPSTSKTINTRNDTTHKIKVECIEESVDMLQSLRHCGNATTDRVSSDDPAMPSKLVTEVNGKRKRYNKHQLPFASGNYSNMAVARGLVLPCLPKSAYSWTHEDGKKKVSYDDTAMPSKSVTEVTGNNKQVLPFASGNYSGMAVARGLVLPSFPKSAYSWTREDGKKKVSSDDPAMPSKSVTEVTGNNKQQGEPRKVLYRMTHVQGYKVKKINAPILEAIFKKHGDIASDCVVKTASVRESILEVVCEVVKRIQTSDVATIVSDMETIEMQVLDAEATNMKVAWLRAHLEAVQKRFAARKKSTLIVKMKANTSLVKRAAKTDLEERRIELVTAQEQFDKAEKCVKVLDLLEMKLNDSFVESAAEEDLGPEQPIL